MKQTIGKGTLIIILLALIANNFLRLTTASASPLAHAQPLSTTMTSHIRQATVQITMIRRQTREEVIGASGDSLAETVNITPVAITAKGLGTLLTYQAATLLVSHNHWPQLSQGHLPDVVRFYDADGLFLFEMDGLAFSQLILFHDSGTLLMQAPPGLVAQLPPTAVMGSVAALQPGDIVHVAYRQTGPNSRIVLLAAEVMAIESHHNLPLLSLRSLEGDSIEPGDSGGGVWLNGRFVGNLWMTVRAVRQDWWRFNRLVESETAFSYAAGLTAELLDIVTLTLETNDEPVLQRDTPS